MENDNKNVEEPHKPSITSRGVPSKECLYLPAYNAPELRYFQDAEGKLTNNNWSLEELMNFVFSKRYQRKYNEVALAFVELILKKGRITGDETAKFITTTQFSKATFYNRVLPRLKRIGMLKVERQTIVALESRRKYRPMRISISNTFGNYLMKIGTSWRAVVDDAKSKTAQEERMRGEMGWKAVEVQVRDKHRYS